MCKGHTYCTVYHYTMILFTVRYSCCMLIHVLPVHTGSAAPSLFHNFFQMEQCTAASYSFGVFSVPSMVEMLTVWMFSNMLLSSIMALFISLSLMALFSTTIVQIASSCSGVKRDPLPPLWSCLAVPCGKNIVMQNTKLSKIKCHCFKYTYCIL